MTQPAGKSATCNVTVRMPQTRLRQIDALAARQERSRNWLINRALRDYLARVDAPQPPHQAHDNTGTNSDDVPFFLNN